jgi:hypothetical protein
VIFASVARKNCIEKLFACLFCSFSIAEKEPKGLGLAGIFLKNDTQDFIHRVQTVALFGCCCSLIAKSFVIFIRKIPDARFFFDLVGE